MKKILLSRQLYYAVFFLLAFLNFTPIQAQTYTWVGGVSTDFYNVNNWDNTAIDFTTLNAATLVIGAGNPNNPINIGHSGADVIAKRPAALNTTTNANAIVTGTFFPNGTSTFNGIITLNGSANVSVRNILYVGKGENGRINLNSGSIGSKNAFYIGNAASGNGTATIAGGTLYAGTYLEVGTGTGNPTGIVNITGGTVDVTTGVNIGTNGQINISGIGQLIVTGDKTTAIQTYITSGKIACTAGKTLDVSYNGTRTSVSIHQDPNSMLREYPSYITLDNGTLVAKIDKNSSNILSLKVNGVETISQSGSHTTAYHDFTSSYGFETIFGATFSVKEETADYIDVSFKRPYTPGSNVTPCDADIHYVLKKNDKGLYVYSILDHKASYPSFDLGSWRQVFWLAHDATDYLTEKIYVNDIKKWEMPKYNDTYETTPIQEIIKYTSGVRNGKYDGKYEYSEPLIDLPAYGFGSDKNHIGSWAVFGSHEFFNSGPTHHDLNAAAGIIHICMNGVHYNSRGFTIDQGEAWSKIYGPYLLYTSTENTADQNWADAKARAAADKAEWPYAWLTNTPQYPLAAQRGNITGTFAINDISKPTMTGKDAWIGVTQLSNGSDGDWQFEEENYQYWVKTDAAGNFDIKNVRPGTYTLFAFKNGETGQFSIANVTVSASATNNLGTITWTIPRTNGSLIWEIGVPDRTAAEYKFGDFDYAEGYVQRKFAATFTNPIIYNVADKNWATALPYVHSKYYNADGTINSNWAWKINFNLPAGMPTTGNTKLTIAYASADHAQQQIYINTESGTPINYYPTIGGGNAFLRQSNHAKYCVSVVDIPMNKLRSGSNYLQLVMPSNSGDVSHLMYDYISLEGDASMVLPVSLLSFNAVADGNSSHLAWTTSSEQNNDRFEILRSTDGIHFEYLSAVKGNGTSNDKHSYSFRDYSPKNGVNYYKLVQYDFNGFGYVQGIKAVNFSLSNTALVNVYPNPATDLINVSIANSDYQKVKISVMNLEGKVALQQQFDKNETGNYALAIKGKVAPGTYIININTGTFNNSNKIIIQ